MKVSTFAVLARGEVVLLLVRKRKEPDHQACLLIGQKQRKQFLLALKRFERGVSLHPNTRDLEIGLNIGEDVSFGLNLKAIPTERPSTSVSKNITQDAGQTYSGALANHARPAVRILSFSLHLIDPGSVVE
jgi:hypothetical protein